MSPAPCHRWGKLRQAEAGVCRSPATQSDAALWLFTRLPSPPPPISAPLSSGVPALWRKIPPGPAGGARLPARSRFPIPAPCRGQVAPVPRESGGGWQGEKGAKAGSAGSPPASEADRGRRRVRNNLLRKCEKTVETRLINIYFPSSPLLLRAAVGGSLALRAPRPLPPGVCDLPLGSWGLGCVWGGRESPLSAA